MKRSYPSAVYIRRAIDDAAANIATLHTSEDSRDDLYQLARQELTSLLENIGVLKPPAAGVTLDEMQAKAGW